MAIVSRNGKIKTVTNLGWLLRHWKEVKDFHVIKWDHFMENGSHRECTLYAWLKGGGYYCTEWASYDICIRWLDRPVFRGVSVEIKQGKG